MAEDADDLAAALLSEAGWVRRVAAGLVRDGGADDVAQDAWVQALLQRPDPSTTLRGWLTEVMRRLAHTRRRAESRRRARELRADTAESPAADRLLEKAELLHRIGQLVGELDEPFRSTVLLRYFEGASAAEIARRCGVPAGTVRWRLKEALDRLRARLGREVDRDRALRVLAPIGGGGGLMVPTLKVALPIVKIVVIGALAAVGIIVGVRHHRGRAPAPAPTPILAPVIVAGPPRVGTPPPTAPPRDVPPRDVPPRDVPPRDVPPPDDIVERAKDAYVRGRYDVAIALARRGMAHDRSKAWQIIGASSCFKNDAAGAAAAWNALGARGRKFVEYVCKRNDVSLRGATAGATAGVADGVRHDRAATPAAPSAPTGAPLSTRDDPLQRAMDDYIHGHYSEAIAGAKQALPAHPDKAWRLIGAASCFNHDGAGAAAAIDALDALGTGWMSADFITYVCKRNGVVLRARSSSRLR